MKKSLKVGVIGFGHIGSVIASTIASSEISVSVVEKNEILIELFLDEKSPIKEPGLQELVSDKIKNNYLCLSKNVKSIADSDVIIITVGTPLSDKHDADLSYLKNACNEIEPVLKNNSLVLIKSTVTPGITRNLIYPILSRNKAISLAFTPERFAEGNAIEELKNLPIVVGGVNSKSTEEACQFWKKALGVNIIKVSSCETAELVKLANNAWIDVNIALANDLARVSDLFGGQIDILEVIEAANSLKKGSSTVNLLRPSSGVGGYCLTKDPLFLYEMGKKNGIELKTVIAGRETNDFMPTYSCDKIVEALKKEHKNLEKIKILVMGLSFKTNSGDIRSTPVHPFLQKLQEYGFSNICAFDPLICDDDYITLGVKKASNIREELRKADCVAVMNGHDLMDQVSKEELIKYCGGGTIIFDGRKYYPREALKDFKSHNLHYIGIGR